MNSEIQLLQFFFCQEFRQKKQDLFSADGLVTNLFVAKFPYYFKQLYAVTCWRKDPRFHKEVLEFATGYGTSIRSPHMDIEPLRGSIFFRWHTHRFPPEFAIEKPTTLTVRVILDRKAVFETYLLIESLGKEGR